MKTVNLTEKETMVLSAFVAESINCCGDFSEDENMSFMNVKDICTATGMTEKSVGGVLSSLLEKKLVSDTGEASRGKHNDFIAEVTSETMALV